ncbi:MAG: SDR family NAD(P)-dependent oxidoreductase, partial [Coriobacteriales bacterium]|nr:SDR family NAD(P)-dependent oxidoreductase [Coriobacteriales bacterium]
MGALDGKVAIVTGSGQGIGRGIAIGLAREGAKVVTNNRKPGGFSSLAYDPASMPEEDYKQMLALSGDAEATVALITSEGGEAVAAYGDVSKWEDAQAIVQKAIDTWGRVDIIVNNAAGMGTGGITQISDVDWDKMTVTKMKGAFNMMKAAVPYMIKQGYGRIFNGSSDAWVGLPGNDAYSAGNAGIVGLTYAAAKELFRFGVTVNAYCPQGQSPAHAVEYNKML